MDFIQFGGLDFLEKCIRVHEKDDYIAIMMPKLQKVILGKKQLKKIMEITLRTL